MSLASYSNHCRRTIRHVFYCSVRLLWTGLHCRLHFNRKNPFLSQFTLNFAGFRRACWNYSYQLYVNDVQRHWSLDTLRLLEILFVYGICGSLFLCVRVELRTGFLLQNVGIYEGKRRRKGRRYVG